MKQQVIRRQSNDHPNRALPPDISDELARNNVEVLNLSSPFLDRSTRFWMPVDSRFSVGGYTQLLFILHSLPDNQTRFPDVQFVVLKRPSPREDYFLEARIIDFSADAGVLIIPRLVALNKQGQAAGYYLEAYHESQFVSLKLEYPTRRKYHSHYCCDGLLAFK